MQSPGQQKSFPKIHYSRRASSDFNMILCINTKFSKGFSGVACGPWSLPRWLPLRRHFSLCAPSSVCCYCGEKGSELLQMLEWGGNRGIIKIYEQVLTERAHSKCQPANWIDPTEETQQTLWKQIHPKCKQLAFSRQIAGCSMPLSGVPANQGAPQGKTPSFARTPSNSISWGQQQFLRCLAINIISSFTTHTLPYFNTIIVHWPNNCLETFYTF